MCAKTEFTFTSSLQNFNYNKLLDLYYEAKKGKGLK